MTNDTKPPKGAMSFSHAPDAADLLKIEQRIELLEKEKAEIESKSPLVPGRNQKLAEIRKELAKLGWERVSTTEHVQASAYQSEIYQREKAVAKRDQEQQTKLERKQAQEVARQGAQAYRESLRAYVANWKKKAKAALGMGADDESEPGS
ncbi:hypothetical protein [Bradyrhizobium japonicum]|uniref:hypothetical protein n=1 Tax=Bradyrhizobium japonicum TaxID=375 RepID=UPI0027155DD5|nr:hypothetical protein [Bradyrhizobium japonicum]WLB57439.1 hypothetical protein QIH94_16045 [Bradyrhizobium japonicum]